MLNKKSQLDFIFAFISGIIFIIAIYIIFLLLSQRPIVNYSLFFNFVKLGTYTQDYNAFFDSYINIQGVNVPAYDVILYLTFFNNSKSYKFAAPILEKDLNKTLNIYFINGISLGIIEENGTIIGHCIVNGIPVKYNTIYGNITLCPPAIINPGVSSISAIPRS